MFVCLAEFRQWIFFTRILQLRRVRLQFCQFCTFQLRASEKQTNKQTKQTKKKLKQKEKEKEKNENGVYYKNWIQFSPWLTFFLLLLKIYLTRDSPS